jgi:hypothetical protein
VNTSPPSRTGPEDEFGAGDPRLCSSNETAFRWFGRVDTADPALLYSRSFSGLTCTREASADAFEQDHRIAARWCHDA